MCEYLMSRDVSAKSRNVAIKRKRARAPIILMMMIIDYGEDHVSPLSLVYNKNHIIIFLINFRFEVVFYFDIDYQLYYKYLLENELESNLSKYNFLKNKLCAPLDLHLHVFFFFAFILIN